MESEKWQRRFLELAEGISSWSKDKSTKVGCVIVGEDRTILATGYNGFPRGIDDDVDSRHQRPEKYLYTEHAERNAIYSAAKEGVRLKGSTIYVPWFPCVDCARGIIQSGIVGIVTRKLKDGDPLADRWKESHAAALELINESGLTLTYI